MSKSAEKKPFCDNDNVVLLHQYCGNFFEPDNWDPDPKAKQYMAKISPGKTSPFERSFINWTKLDDKIVFRKDHFKDGDIIEQRCSIKKGKATLTGFEGFFLIKSDENSIYGQFITQKDTLEYFNCKQTLPEIHIDKSNHLKAKLQIIIEKLGTQYGEEAVFDTLTTILGEKLPKPDTCIEE